MRGTTCSGGSSSGGSTLWTEPLVHRHLLERGLQALHVVPTGREARQPRPSPAAAPSMPQSQVWMRPPNTRCTQTCVPTHNLTVFRNRVFGAQVRINEVMRMGL